jgi:hypothetical protein
MKARPYPLQNEPHTFKKVEERATEAANCETITQIFKDATWTGLSIVLNSTRHLAKVSICSSKCVDKLLRFYLQL